MKKFVTFTIAIVFAVSTISAKELYTISLIDTLSKDIKTIDNTIKRQEFEGLNVWQIDSILKEENSFIPTKHRRCYYCNPFNSDKIFFVVGMKTDITFADFSMFKPILGDQLTPDYKELRFPSIGIELGGYYKRFYLGLNYGSAIQSTPDKDIKHYSDTISRDLNNYQWGLFFGYNLINSNHWIITPKVGIKWNRLQMLNSDLNYKIPIEQYVNNRNLDIRFNQLLCTVGLDIAYKIPDPMFSNGDIYWTLGLFCGYTFNINKYPWVYTDNNRLLTNTKIRIKPVNLSFFVALNF